MNIEELKKIIEQIKRYDLVDVFDNSKELEQWLKKLNKKEINNFINLNIDPSKILFMEEILINKNLLKCNDYDKRIEAMMKLENGEGCWHLFDRLCSQKFLNSKNYYKDMEMLIKADNLRYALWVVDNEVFINSPYHDEDLKLIVEAEEAIVAESLSITASNNDSINSKYHQKDMELIAKSDYECLQMSNTYPEGSLNNLAVNKTSLNDNYHLENMQILSKDLIANEFLYNIMTNQFIISGENYRAEVDALVNAKSKLKARAMYYYIANIDNKYDDNFRDDFPYDIMDPFLLIIHKNSKTINGNKDPEYLKQLGILNEIADEFVMFYESLLTNCNLFNSPYRKHDLDLMLTISDSKIFMDLYKVMISRESLEGPYHKEDINLISNITDAKKRSLLFKKAINEYSIKSPNHLYDMNYITKLDLENIDNEILNNMCYYLFTPMGIDDIKHIEKLEKLFMGELVKKSNSVTRYMDNLEERIQNREERITKNKKRINMLKLFNKSPNDIIFDLINDSKNEYACDKSSELQQTENQFRLIKKNKNKKN